MQRKADFDWVCERVLFKSDDFGVELVTKRNLEVNADRKDFDYA